MLVHRVPETPISSCVGLLSKWGGGLSMSEMVPRQSQDKGQLMLQAGPGGTVGGHTNAPSCLVPKA